MKISLRAKAVVGIICMSLIISATAIALSYRAYANTMDEHYQKMCLDLAESAITMLDSEKMKYYAETLEKDEYYDEQRDILCRLVEANDSALYIYVATALGGGSFREGDPLYDIMDTDPTVMPPEEEVVEVSAHLLGRVHGGVHVELLPLREGRENPGQHVRLDLGGHVQLGADALLLRRDGGQVLDVLVDLQLHGLDGLGEGLDLVAGADVQLGNGRTLLPIFSGGDSAHPCGGGAPLTGAAVGHVLQSGTGYLIDGVDYKPVHQQHQDHAGGDHSRQNCHEHHM